MKSTLDFYLFLLEQEAATSISAVMARGNYEGLQASNDLHNRAYRDCGNLEGEERKRCKTNYKIQSFEARARAMQNQRRYCTQTRDPSQCVKQLTDKANKYLQKAGELRA